MEVLLRRVRRTDDIRAGRVNTTNTTLQSRERQRAQRGNAVGGGAGDEHRELTKVSR